MLFVIKQGNQDSSSPCNSWDSSGRGGCSSRSLEDLGWGAGTRSTQKSQPLSALPTHPQLHLHQCVALGPCPLSVPCFRSQRQEQGSAQFCLASSHLRAFLHRGAPCLVLPEPRSSPGGPFSSFRTRSDVSRGLSAALSSSCHPLRFPP